MASRGFPSMTALLAMLAVLGYQNRDKIADALGKLNPPGPDGKGGVGGLLEKLGLDTKSGSAGGILAGGLGELLDRFKNSGQADTVDSWVKTGPNKSCSEADLEKALGSEVMDSLVQHTGLTRQELAARLCRELPEAVDKYTPQGQLPLAEGRA